jgi:hypothetical protein
MREHWSREPLREVGQHPPQRQPVAAAGQKDAPRKALSGMAEAGSKGHLAPLLGNSGRFQISLPRIRHPRHLLSASAPRKAAATCSWNPMRAEAAQELHLFFLGVS